MCLDLNVYVPGNSKTYFLIFFLNHYFLCIWSKGGVAANELVFEVVPDTLSPTVSTHVCKSIVKNVGSNLPCVKANAKSYLIDQSYQNISIPGNTLVIFRPFFDIFATQSHLLFCISLRTIIQNSLSVAHVRIQSRQTQQIILLQSLDALRFLTTNQTTCPLVIVKC